MAGAKGDEPYFSLEGPNGPETLTSSDHFYRDQKWFHYAMAILEDENGELKFFQYLNG